MDKSVIGPHIELWSFPSSPHLRSYTIPKPLEVPHGFFLVDLFISVIYNRGQWAVPATANVLHTMLY